tara:strand:+ start:1249 stop:1431 length:183 start_codon:yes stop_codon:yes gene_type:complete
LLGGVVPVDVTAKVDQEVVPCETCIVLSGTPKDYKVTLIFERTTLETVTLREAVKAAAVV